MLKYAVAAGAVYVLWKWEHTKDKDFLHFLDKLLVNNDFLEQIDDLIDEQDFEEVKRKARILAPEMCPIDSNNLNYREKIADLKCRPTWCGQRGTFANNYVVELNCLANCTRKELNELYSNGLFGWSGFTTDVQSNLPVMESLAKSNIISNNPNNICATVRTMITPPINEDQLYDWKTNFMKTYPQAKFLVNAYLKLGGDTCGYTNY